MSVGYKLKQTSAEVQAAIDKIIALQPGSLDDIGIYIHDSSYWTEHNDFVPEQGALVAYTDTAKFKMGDGVTAVANLDFLDADLQNAVKFTAQILTAEQKAQARENIGAGTYSKPSGGIPDTDIAAGVIPDISGKADKSEMSVVAGTGADADKTTITLKSGTSATVLTSHQSLAGKQDTLVSGTNIKTINDQSILGEGNIVIQGGGGSDDAVLYTEQSLTDAQKQQALANIEATHYLTVGGKKIWSGSEDAYEALIPRDDTLYFVGPPDYSQKYLTFKAREAGTFSFEHYGDGGTIEYSLDGGTTWDELNEGDDTPTVAAGAEILWRCSDYDLSGESGMVNFKATGALDIYGNIMSLLYGDDFVGQTAMPEYEYTFDYIFDSMPVVEARNLILPAMTLYDACYEGMFSCCENLISAPKLPATVMASECYGDMFDGCESLVKTPDLSHVTTLADQCFTWMFGDCTSLEKVTELPATTLVESCYKDMFNGCTSLVTAPELPATILAEECYNGMFAGCESLVVAPELPATTLAEECYYNMFNGCTSLVNAPQLPATTLAPSCYVGMFQLCTSLVTAPDLPATILAGGCYTYMFNGCTSLVNAPELPATILTVECYAGMFADCTSLNYIKCLATDRSAINGTFSWVKNVASSGTFVKAAGQQWSTGVSGIPTGWTVQEAS